MASNMISNQFTSKINKILEECKKILDNNRKLQIAEEVPHKYTDKYLLANFLTNSTLASQLQCLQKLGLTPDILAKLFTWQKENNRSVSLRFVADEQCSFLRSATRKADTAVEYVTEYSVGLAKGKVTDKYQSTITEYFWKFTVDYKLFAFQGNTPTENIEIFKGSGTCEIVTSSDHTPKPISSTISPISLNITWLLQQLKDASGAQIIFEINRAEKHCKTPRRNNDISNAFSYLTDFNSFASSICSYFTNRLFPTQGSHGLDLSCINDSTIFCPILPLFEEHKAKVEAVKNPTFKFYEDIQSDVILSTDDVSTFLLEEDRTIKEKFSSIEKVITDSKKLITHEAVKLIINLIHCRTVCSHFADGLCYIEDLLRKQLISAIGKVVTVVEFAEYMEFHNRKLFKDEYKPSPFCYAIRRPDHYPEGILSIEANISNNLAQPIRTLTKKSASITPMQFPINASTNISLYGDRYVHGYMAHEFSQINAASLQLVARARQFSSFMLVVGRIAGPNLFEPISGIIIQNKDDLAIPLLLEKVPTPQAFKDAIESLSPEQQRFAKAFRSMQLESTLFGLCVIQIKPQLEKVLNLTPESLTKEIRLTQDVMELFIKYQIPSDLMSFEGATNATVTDKLDQVKRNVAAVHAMIQKAKDDELQERKKEVEFRQMEERIKHNEIREKTKRKKYKKKSKSAAPMKMKKKSANFSSAKKGVKNVAAPQFEIKSIAVEVNKNTSSNSDIPPSTPSDATTTTDDKQPQTAEDILANADSSSNAEDLTQLPVKLDAKFEELDVDNSLCATIINPGTTWQLKKLESLLAKPKLFELKSAEVKTEKNRAFDLLDALSKSGLLCFDDCTVHVIVASTHCFDKSVLETLVQDNINPIEKVERSSLIVASTIHNLPAAALIQPNQLHRVKLYSPNLFDK